MLRLLMVLAVALMSAGLARPDLMEGHLALIGLGSVVSVLFLQALSILFGQSGRGTTNNSHWKPSAPARHPRNLRRQSPPNRPAPQRHSGRPKILVDGSNVLHWAGQGPNLATVRDVLHQIDAQGLEPIVYFDANVGYLVGDKWLGPGAMAQKLGLGYSNVVVADRGTPADPLLLEASRGLGARIVSNDRYRDWQTQFPEAATPGHMVRGRMGEAGVSLML